MAAKPRLSLKGRGLQLLSQREHSRSELRRKLLAHLKAEARAAQRVAAALQGDEALPHRSHALGPADPAAPAEPEAQAAQVDAVLDWLQAHRYLSEERFAESRVHARASRYGNLRIRQELAQHGIALSPDATQALKDNELPRAQAVWERKFGTPAADPRERAKQARFLAARGFSSEVIRRVLQARHPRVERDADEASLGFPGDELTDA